MYKMIFVHEYSNTNIERNYIMTRHESRETAFIICFEMLFQQDSEIKSVLSGENTTELYKISEFAKQLASTVLENMQEIDEIIEENLVKWSSSRISKVSKAVLRLATAELKYTDVPVGVAVNEAVEICKKYSTSADAAYINGVLSAIAKKVRE